MKNVNWGSVEESNFDRVAPGGYICIISAVMDEEAKEYLKIEYDIADGPLKDYYKNLYASKGFWGGSFIRSYRETALGFFKSFLVALERSNSNFRADAFNNDPQKLRRLLMGLVIGEEEYKANDGSIKKRLYVAEVRSVDSIRKGDYKIPEFKKHSDGVKNTVSSSNGFHPISDTEDDDLPF